MEKLRHIKFGIGAKLLVSFLALSLVPLLIGGGLCFRVSKKQLEKSAEAYLSELARDCGRKISYYVNSRYEGIKLLSQADVFVDNDTDAKQEYIEKAIKAYPFFDAISVIDLNGTIMACTRKELVGESRADRIWFQRTIRSKKDDIVPLDAYRAKTARWKMAIGFNLPIIDAKNKKVVGVLTTRTSIEDIVGQVRALDERSAVDDHVYLVTGEGEILALSNEKGFLTSQGVLESPVVRDLLADKTRITKYKDDEGEDVISARYALNAEGALYEWGWGWAVIVTEPVSKAFRPAYMIRNTVIALTLVVGFLITMFAVFISKGFSRPITQISESALRISQGDLKPIRIEYKPRDEIGDLVTAFNRMTADLHSTTVSRDSLAEEIAGRKRVEEEKLKLEAQLYQAHKMEAIATLAGGIAHQFNNALSAITGNIELLQMYFPDNEDIGKYVEPVKGSAYRMADLTHQLLAYARGGKYNPKTVSLSGFVKDTLSFIKHTIKPEIRVETDLPHDIPDVKADLTQMQMVISAVLNNADEAIEGQGCIRIITKTEKIDNEFVRHHPGHRPGTYVSLTVEDDGRGMDEQTRSKVFEPFFTTKFQGRGLGLAAVYGIVKNHDGWISVESEFGKGTVVCIYLPAVETKKKEVEEPRSELVKGTGTIMIIEDEETIMSLNRLILERLGYRVLEAGNGVEAVRLAGTFEGDIDLAILDIALPDMAGKEVYHLLKESRPDLKVIICSGYDISGPAHEILEAGAQGFIQKPYSLATLSEKVKEVLEGKCEI